jgi:hypothetical protein
MTQQNEQRDEAIENAVVELLNVVVISDRCKLCGEHDDNHAIGCPVPALEEWINPSTLD